MNKNISYIYGKSASGRIIFITPDGEKKPVSNIYYNGHPVEQITYNSNYNGGSGGSSIEYFRSSAGTSHFMPNMRTATCLACKQTFTLRKDEHYCPYCGCYVVDGEEE